jgi:hypothetical protein
MTDGKSPPTCVPASDIADDDPCGCADRPLIADFALDALDLLLIDVVRFVCISFASGSCSGWEAAHDHAEAALGSLDGPVLVAGVVALLRAVRCERAGRFDYMSPTCPDCRLRISQSEIEVLRVLGAARRGDREAMQGAAALIAGRKGPPERIALAGRALGALLERCTAPQGAGPFVAHAAAGRLH